MCKEKRKVFSYNPDIRKNAYMNWRTDRTDAVFNLRVLAEGYLDAAQCLVENVLEDNSGKKADSLIYATLYSLDQSIELYEKCVLVLVHKLMKKSYTIPNHHDIKQLYGEMIARINEKEGTAKGLKANFRVVENYIGELYGYIAVPKGKPDIDFARYPIRTDGTAHFYVSDPENVVINIENLKEVIKDIKDVFYGITSMYMDEIIAQEELL